MEMDMAGDIAEREMARDIAEKDGWLEMAREGDGYRYR